MYEIHVETTTSTNDIIRRELEKATNPHDLIFASASMQTHGRGRNGRVWHGDPNQNVYLSFGERHHQPLTPERLSSYMWLASLTVLDTLHDVAPLHPFRLKYPNDVQTFHDGAWAKISGSLVEHVFQGDQCVVTIVGIGINVQQRSFPDMIDQPCASLATCGIDVSVDHVVRVLKNKLLEQRTQSVHELFDRWKQAIDIEGSEVRILDTDGIWRVDRVLPDGRLLVSEQHSHNERILSNGDSLRYLH